MFTAENVQSRLKDRPFVPLRIVLSTGQTYDIFHPDLVFVGARFLIIGLPGPHSPALAEQVTRVPLLHVTQLRDLAPPASPTGNGQA